MLNSHKEVEVSLSNLLKKLVIIVIGSIIAAYGITLALYAGFGGATLAVLWQGISKTFHLSIGMASFIVALGMIFRTATGTHSLKSMYLEKMKRIWRHSK